MVLQRGSAVVWGYGQPGATVTTEIASTPAVSTVVGADSIWRQVLSTGAANKAGTNNLTAELAAADASSSTIRFFTVGMETDCRHTDCSKPFTELAHGANIRSNMSAACRGGSSCRESWQAAGSASLGA